MTQWWEGEPNTDVEPIAQSNEVYDIAPFQPGDSHCLRIEAWEDYAPGGLFHLTIVFLEEDVPGDIEYGPMFVVSAFAQDEEYLDAEGGMMDYLEQVTLDDATVQLIHPPGGGGPFSPGRIIIGGLGPVPIIDPTLPPKPGSAGTGKRTVQVPPPSGG